MTERFPIMIGDTLEPLNVIISGIGGPKDLSAYTVKILVKDAANTVVLNDVVTGVTAQPTQAFTADASLDILKRSEHGVNNGQQVLLATSGTLPGGLAVLTRYYVIESDDNRFKLTTSRTGTAIDITDAGTGNHTFAIIGSVQVDWQSTEVAAVRGLKAWIRLFLAGEIDTYPKDSAGIPIDVKALGD